MITGTQACGVEHARVADHPRAVDLIIEWIVRVTANPQDSTLPVHQVFEVARERGCQEIAGKSWRD